MDIDPVDFEWSYDGLVEPLTVAVVETGTATVLVGGGDEPIAEAVCALARERDVDAVVAEHGHVDHYGAIPVITDAMDLTVAAPAADAHVLRGAGITVDRELEPGREYWGIETVGVPGHTPGNMAFLADGALLAGDAVAGSDSMFAEERSRSGPLSLFDPAYDDDHRAAAESVATLRGLDLDRIYLPHGAHVETAPERAVETLCADLAV